jgi:minor extracellular protease Epr
MKKQQKKSNIKKVFASTVAATMLLSSGLPVLASTEGTSDSLPSLPTLPSLNEPTTKVIKGEYIVTFKEGTPIETIKQDIEQYGGKIVDGDIKSNVVAVKLTDEQYEKMKKDTDVEIIEKNQSVELLAYGPLSQYSHEKTNVSKAWESGLSGKGVKIAVLDTGISQHSDLEVAGGVSTVDYTNSYSDDNGHGTHVAGIIASKNNGIGTTGVASDAEIYSVKVLNYAGKGDLMDIIEGIDWAIQQGVDIINVSLGTNTDSASLKAKIDEATSKGIIVVAASGNSGNTNITYPAKYDNVIAVGATDQNNKLASFSSRGPEIDVVAPGAGVVSTYLGNMYANGNGTSQAAPYVAGMLALLTEQYPDKSAHEITQMLFDNALDLGEKGKDPLYGYGLVQYPTSKQAEEPKNEEPAEQESVVEEEQQEPKQEEVKEEPSEPTDEEKPVQDEQPTNEETKPVEQKPVQEVKEKVKAELPEGVTFDEKEKIIRWEPFANANRYRVQIDQKDSNGNYRSYKYPQTVLNTEYDLSHARLEDNHEYKISIIPRIGFKYEEDQAIELYATSEDQKLIVSGNEDSLNEKTEDTKVQPSTSVDPTQKAVTKEMKLPEGVTFDKEENTIRWESFANANRYRVKMETIDSNGNLKSYKFPKTVIETEFDLSYLRDKDNYKISIIPRIGFTYDEEQAIELFVSNKGKEVIVTGLSDNLEELIKEITTQSNTEEKDELSIGLSYNEITDTISWNPIDGATFYRLEIERKNANGEYKYYIKRTIYGSKFNVSKILLSGYEYKVKIVPRVGFKYDDDKAIAIYVSTKNGKVTVNTLN